MSRTTEQRRDSTQWPEIRKCRLWMDDRQCLNCGCDEEAANDIEVHHIHPVSAGGNDNLPNLRTLCERCHKHLHRQEPVGDKYPISLLDGVELPDRPVRPELPVDVDSNELGVIRKRVVWMVSADLAILEFLYSARDAYGNPAIQSPSTVAKNTGYSSEHIGNRCREELLSHELVERESRGYYRISEKGAKLVNKELNPDDLNEESD